MLYKRHFNELACTEREDEGPVAYVTTWLVNGHRFPRCQLSRVVRLRSDGAAWQRSLTDAWRDRLDLRLRVNFFWIDPVPSNPVTQHVIGHIIIVQEPRPEHAAVLLTGIAHVAHQDDIFHCAMHLPERQTAQAIVDLLPVPSHLREFPYFIHIGTEVIESQSSRRLESGDNFIIHIQVNVPFRDEPRVADFTSQFWPSTCPV